MSVDTVPAPAPADTGAPAPAAGSASPSGDASNNDNYNNGATSPNAGNNGGRAGGAAAAASGEGQFTLRALVTSKEAGIIIGKGGKNVADLREATGVKAGVSKVVQGVPERVLSVSGTLEGVTKVSFLHLHFNFPLCDFLPDWTINEKTKQNLHIPTSLCVPNRPTLPSSKTSLRTHRLRTTISREVSHHPFTCAF